MPKSNDFARFIDELRDSRNISREDFVRNIISLRQYYRYIRGESSLKDETLTKLLEILEFSSIHAYETFLKKQDNDYVKLINIYKLIYLGNFKIADEEFLHIELSPILSNMNLKILEYIEIRLGLHNERIVASQAFEEIIELMDYPNILKKESLSFIEISCIMFVSDELIRRGDYRFAEYGYKLLDKKNEEQFSEFKEQLLPLQLTVMKGLGKIGKHEQSIQISQRAIDEFEVHTPLSLLLSVYYVKALNERELYKDNRYRETLVQIFSICKLLKNENLVTETKKLIRSVFDIKESELIIYIPQKK